MSRSKHKTPSSEHTIIPFSQSYSYFSSSSYDVSPPIRPSGVFAPRKQAEQQQQQQQQHLDVDVTIEGNKPKTAHSRHRNAEHELCKRNTRSPPFSEPCSYFSSSSYKSRPSVRPVPLREKNKQNNNNTSTLMSRSSKDGAFPPSERSMSYSGGGGAGGGDDGEAAELTPNAPTAEGYGDPQPLLYGGGEEAAAIASRCT